MTIVSLEKVIIMSEDVRKKSRPDSSQRFPFISLPRAVERARELYNIASTHEIPLSAAVKAWGYADKSSGGLQTVAALKMFGLIDDFSSAEARRIKLTDIALRILRDPRDISPDRDALIKQSAFLPPIHNEVIQTYGGLPPSDIVFKTYLLLDKKMKEDAAADFMKEFTATVNYAKYTGEDIPPIFANPINESEKINNNQLVMSETLAEPSNSFNNELSNSVESESSNKDKHIRVLLDGNHLRVSAFVDLKGLKKLKRILDANAALLAEEDIDQDD